MLLLFIRLVVENDEETNFEQKFEYSTSNTKRCRHLTSKGREYKEQTLKSKKKKENH